MKPKQIQGGEEHDNCSQGWKFMSGPSCCEAALLTPFQSNYNPGDIGYFIQGIAVENKDASKVFFTVCENQSRRDVRIGYILIIY